MFDSVILNRMVSPSKKGTGMVEPENMITLKFVQDALTNKDGRLQCIQTRTVLFGCSEIIVCFLILVICDVSVLYALS